MIEIKCDHCKRILDNEEIAETSVIANNWLQTRQQAGIATEHFCRDSRGLAHEWWDAKLEDYREAVEKLGRKWKAGLKPFYLKRESNLKAVQ